MDSQYRIVITLIILYFMKHLFSSILFIILLNSCDSLSTGSKTIDVEVENKSGGKISNIKISTSEDLEKTDIAELANDTKVSKKLSLKDNKADGSYSIEFTRENGKTDKKQGGYYSNGKALEKTMSISIQKDSVIFNFRK